MRGNVQLKALCCQFWAAFALSVRRLVRSKFIWTVIVLGSIPIAIDVLIALAHHLNRRGPWPIGQANEAFGLLVRMLYLPFVVFFCAVGLGHAVARQEFEDRTLHYLLLQPVARWVMISARLAAGLAITVGAFVVSLWGSYVLLAAATCGFDSALTSLFAQGWWKVLAKESLILSLGLLAYGAIAMVMSSVFKSVFYAVFLLGWEASLPYLPSTIKFWTVSHYLQSLLPQGLARQRRLLELLGEPASITHSLLVVFGVSLVFIAIASLIFQFRECMYGET